MIQAYPSDQNTAVEQSHTHAHVDEWGSDEDVAASRDRGLDRPPGPLGVAQVGGLEDELGPSSERVLPPWWESLDASILPFARRSLAAAPGGRNDLLALLTRFTETERWDDPETLMAAYGHHNAVVERTVPSDRLLQRRPGDGWGPICDALGLPVPREPFPWVNKREEWA